MISSLFDFSNFVEFDISNEVSLLNLIHVEFELISTECPQHDDIKKNKLVHNTPKIKLML